MANGNKSIQLSQYGLVTDFLDMAPVYPSAVHIMFDDKGLHVMLFFAEPEEFKQVHQMIVEKNIQVREFTADEMNAPLETAPDRGMVMFKTTKSVFSFWKGMPQLLDGPWSS